MSDKTKRFFSDNIAPETLFIASMLCLPPFLFQHRLIFTVITVFMFAALNFLKKGKIKLLPSLIIIICIVFFNLLTPTGKVLFRAGTFPIAEGSLIVGLRKGLLLTGMVFISKFAISRNLHLSGKIGKLTSRMFAYFDSFTALKINLKPKKLIESIDEKLMETYNSTAVPVEFKSKITTSPAGKIFFISLLILCWGFFVLSFFTEGKL